MTDVNNFSINGYENTSCSMIGIPKKSSSEQIDYSCGLLHGGILGSVNICFVIILLRSTQRKISAAMVRSRIS